MLCQQSIFAWHLPITTKKLHSHAFYNSPTTNNATNHSTKEPNSCEVLFEFICRSKLFYNNNPETRQTILLLNKDSFLVPDQAKIDKKHCLFGLHLQTL